MMANKKETDAFLPLWPIILVLLVLFIIGLIVNLSGHWIIGSIFTALAVIYLAVGFGLTLCAGGWSKFNRLNIEMIFWLPTLICLGMLMPKDDNSNEGYN